MAKGTGLRYRRLVPSIIFLLSCLLLCVNVWLYLQTKAAQATSAASSAWTRRDTDEQAEGGEVVGVDIERWAGTCDRCLVSPEVCGKYGSHNVDLSRAFDGTGARVQRVLRKSMNGEAIKIGAIGGSITRGHGCRCRPWHLLVGDWWNATFPDAQSSFVDGSVGARGSNYYQYCHEHHLPRDVDLVLMEMSVDDLRMTMDAFNDFEVLLRAILNYPNKPAVIVLQTMQVQDVSATGGDAQLSTCGYYDVPVINMRNYLLPKFMADYSAAQDWFVWNNGADRLHPKADGHVAMADLINLYLAQQICYIDNNRPSLPPKKGDSITQEKECIGIDSVPRIRLAQKLEPKNVQADIQPSCKTVDYFGSYLEPNQAGTQGWEIWKLPPLEKQKFWRTTDIGSVITFDLDMSIGKISMFYLRSSTMRLGAVNCWLDDDTSKIEMVEGWWARNDNLGQFKELTFGGKIPTGKHQLHCENIGAPNHNHPERDTFLLMGLLSV